MRVALLDGRLSLALGALDRDSERRRLTRSLALSLRLPSSRLPVEPLNELRLARLRVRVELLERPLRFFSLLTERALVPIAQLVRFPGVELRLGSELGLHRREQGRGGTLMLVRRRFKTLLKRGQRAVLLPLLIRKGCERRLP